MTQDEFRALLDRIQQTRCETATLELKAAAAGCPQRLYDTLSAFSNQDDGGCIVFGVDEAHGFAETGVYDAQDLQKKVQEQCLQMEPVVRPLLTVLARDGRTFVAAEIPGLDAADRPCHYKGRGRLHGSYVRCGDSDQPMTEYEVYSYEAFRKKYQDELRTVPGVTTADLDRKSLDTWLQKLKRDKPHLAQLPDAQICRLMCLEKDGEAALWAVLLFSPYPQAWFPQLAIIATALPGTAAADGARFLDNQRIEGPLPEMLETALQFCWRNLKKRSVIDARTGKRDDVLEYPPETIREALINALVHRDYSIHTEGMPVQLQLYPDRLEICSPGGLYGRLGIDQLGHCQPDTRNPKIATAMELLGYAENRYSGIPLMRRQMHERHLPAPDFSSHGGMFRVILREQETYAPGSREFRVQEEVHGAETLAAFCSVPRSREEIAAFLGIASVPYALRRYVRPLVAQGVLRMTVPDRPRSRQQRYVRDEP